MSNKLASFQNLDNVAKHRCNKLEERKHILLFAYNGTGKTQLSMAFTEQSKSSEERDHIKISRGEENLFIWRFFLSIVQLMLDQEEGFPYGRVNYIDDPISSLDDNNAIQLANHLAQLLKVSNNEIKTVILSHHTLFFKVICNELYTYHCSMLRHILEKSASFHGVENLSDFIQRDETDPNGILHRRIIQLLNHDGYSHFEPQERIEENKRHFKNILNKFMNGYEFNPELFPKTTEETSA